MANYQLVWKTQPGGRLIGLGTSPSKGTMVNRLSGSGTKILEINALVYG